MAQRIRSLIAISVLALCGLGAGGAIAAPPSVTTLNYPAQTGNWDCTPTCFCCLLQKFHWQRTGIDPGPLSSQFMGDLSYDLGYASAPDHGFGCGVGMEIARSFGSCIAALCRPGEFTITAEMRANANQFRSTDPFLWKSGIGAYDDAVALLKSNAKAGMVFGPTSHHALAALGVDEQSRLIVLNPYPLFPWNKTPQIYHLNPLVGRLLWSMLGEDDVIAIFGK
jgi:hypothetical protein